MKRKGGRNYKFKWKNKNELWKGCLSLLFEVYEVTANQTFLLNRWNTEAFKVLMIAKVHLTVTLQRRVAQQNANCTIFYGGVLRTSSRLSQPYKNKLLGTLVIRHWILTTVASKLSRWLPMMFWPVLFLWLLLISLFKHDFFVVALAALLLYFWGSTVASQGVFANHRCGQIKQVWNCYLNQSVSFFSCHHLRYCWLSWYKHCASPLVCIGSYTST